MVAVMLYWLQVAIHNQLLLGVLSNHLKFYQIMVIQQRQQQQQLLLFASWQRMEMVVVAILIHFLLLSIAFEQRLEMVVMVVMVILVHFLCFPPDSLM